jgi:hypothetical protein
LHLVGLEQAPPIGMVVLVDALLIRQLRPQLPGLGLLDVRLGLLLIVHNFRRIVVACALATGTPPRASLLLRALRTRKPPAPLHLYCFLKIQKATHPDSVAMRRISFSLSSITKSLRMTEPSGPVLTKEPVQSASTV